MNPAPFLNVVKMLHQTPNANVTMTRAQLQFVRSAIRAAIQVLKAGQPPFCAEEILEDVDAALKAVEQRA